MDQARYAELFRTEAREHLAELDAALLAFEQQADPSLVATLFRSTHTIKGMAAAMGYHAVERLSHALESLLDAVRGGQSMAGEVLVALLFEGTDALRSCVDEAVAGRGDEVPEGLTPLLQRLEAFTDPQSAAPAPTPGPLAGLSPASPIRREAAGDALRTVRVDRRRLDTLLDLVGELVVTRDRLLRVAEEHDLSPTRVLTRTAHETARLIGALRDEVLQARMVPVGQVFDRFPRLVRDMARTLGKDVQFETEGRDIELDRTLLDAIGDPIVHLLRNALDHGLEDAASRRAAGKRPAGRLVLRAVRDRAAVLLQVEDDGRGIDRQVILRRAREQGILPDSAASLDDDALLRVLAHAGFSTARAVTSISGRGVGVDVVATRARALGGVLEIETRQGQGTCFTLRLPVTLAITRVLLVEVAGATYALPAAQVVEALAYDPGLIVTVADRERLVWREEELPVVHLRERFGHARRIEDPFLAVVDVAGRRAAVVVDALVAQQEIVVKPLDAVRGSEPWFSGATILGDGTPALIVDLGSLT